MMLHSPSQGLQHESYCSCKWQSADTPPVNSRKLTEMLQAFYSHALVVHTLLSLFTSLPVPHFEGRRGALP